MCKEDDHGIAMLFGLSPQEDDNSFDPVVDFDFDVCTITINSVTTNYAMFRRTPDGWSDIRTVLKETPLRHPLWRVDSALGDKIWRSGPLSDVVLLALVPYFHVELLPLDNGMSGEVSHPPTVLPTSIAATNSSTTWDPLSITVVSATTPLSGLIHFRLPQSFERRRKMMIKGCWTSWGLQASRGLHACKAIKSSPWEPDASPSI